MAAEIRATGLSEEQTTALLDELNERGFPGAASTPNGDDDSKVDVRIGLEGQTDVRALSTWLDQQGITHAIVQDGPGMGGQE